MPVLSVTTVSISTTPAVVVPASFAPKVAVSNEGSAVVFLGEFDVSPRSGIPLAPGHMLPFDHLPGRGLHAVTAAGTGVVGFAAIP